MSETNSFRGSRIMIIDDEKHFLESIRGHLNDRGYEPVTAGSGEEALGMFDEFHPDVVITDQKMPGMDGIHFVRRLRELDPCVPILVMTAYSNLRDAIESIKSGAFDYITKPFMIDDLEMSIRKALRMTGLEKENVGLRAEKAQGNPTRIIGESAMIHDVRKWISKVGPTDATALILGETGTGKDLVARALHESNPARKGPFVIFDCGAFSPSLMESELFGHVKGAFTGADSTKQGYVETARGGTLFFDEIGELDLGAQTRLLRLIDGKTYTPVGSAHKRVADIRIVAASNRDLDAAVKDNKFRQDLYWRLCGLTFSLPPLRERREDIPLLARHFLISYSRKYRKPVGSFSPDAAELINCYSWVGNIRELKNVIEGIVLTCESLVIKADVLPARIAGSTGFSGKDMCSSVTYREAKKRVLEKFDRKYLSQLLSRFEGNVSRASEVAGIERSNFLRLLRRLDIDPEGFRENGSPSSDREQ